MRRFLVISLVLLQYAAPLVHAHAGGNASPRGLHLHELEGLRLISGGVSLNASHHAANAESCIIEIGSAIKRTQTIAHATPILLSLDETASFVVARDAKIINFSPQDVDAISKPFLKHSASRAPPL